MKLLLALLTLSLGLAAHAGQIRNQETVISGAVTRAGTTKKAQYNDDTLTALCEQGYTLAIFLYSGATARTVRCSGGRAISYLSVTKFQAIDPVVNRISTAVNAGGKAIFHCWNGTHATGFVAAAVLNRLCGFSGAQAARYFENGVPPGSIPQSSINKLSGILKAQPTGGHVMAGCPSAH
jgi:hypothetical protein